MCMCMSLALNAAGPLSVSKTTVNSIAFSWLLPDGYFDGFHIYGIAALRVAAECDATVYGKNCTH